MRELEVDILEPSRKGVLIMGLVEEYSPRLEAAMRLSIGDLIDCGEYGCVYETDDSRYVLKLTADVSEAYAWRDIRDLQRTDADIRRGAAIVRSIFRLTTGPDVVARFPDASRYELYGIVREELSDLGDASPAEDDALFEYNVAIARQPEAIPSPAGTPRVRAAIRDMADVASLRELSRTLSMLDSKGVVLGDLHWMNLGRKPDGGVAIRDPGVSSASPYGAVEEVRFH